MKAKLRLERFALGACCAGLLSPSWAGEIVGVKYRGPVDLAPFSCEWTPQSSVVKRLCYDRKERYAVVNLAGTYYHHCEIPPGVLAAWRNAESLGRFYNAQVKGRFDCRVLRMPEYRK